MKKKSAQQAPLARMRRTIFITEGEKKPVASDAVIWTEHETAAFLRLNAKTLYLKRRTKGAGPNFLRYGGRTIRYAKSDVLAWLETQRHA